jgi:hypothetical protein
VTHGGGRIRPGAPSGPAGRAPWEQRYLTWLYWAAAAGLVPWIIYLYFSQTPSAVTHKVHVLAVGLLLAMVLGVLMTAWTYRRRWSLAVMVAAFTGTATFITAWFRALTRSAASNWAGSLPAFLTVAAVIVGLCGYAAWRELSAGRDRARWLPPALAVAALALVPSLVIVLTVVPQVQIAHHLPLAWTGLDVFELIALAATGFALHRRSTLTAVPAAITGTLLLCDAWINVIPTVGMARAEAIVLAFVEVPLAALSFWIGAWTVRHGVRSR